MAGPKDVAKVLFEYDYPVWRMHDEDAARAIWEDFGAKVGPRACLLGGSMKD